VLVGVEYFSSLHVTWLPVWGVDNLLCVLWIAPLDSSERVAREAREAESLVGYDEVLEKVPSSLTIPRRTGLTHRRCSLPSASSATVWQLWCVRVEWSRYNCQSTVVIGNVMALSTTPCLHRSYSSTSSHLGLRRTLPNMSLPLPSGTWSWGTCRFPPAGPLVSSVYVRFSGITTLSLQPSGVSVESPYFKLSLTFSNRRLRFNPFLVFHS